MRFLVPVVHTVNCGKTTCGKCEYLRTGRKPYIFTCALFAYGLGRRVNKKIMRISACLVAERRADQLRNYGN